MPKMTERSAKWMETVRANFREKSGKSVEEWIRLAKKAGLEDEKSARKWLRDEQHLTTVQATFVIHEMFPDDEASEEDLVAAQFSGAKEALRPVYDALVKAAEKFGDDVMIAPRKSQVTFARHTTFAVVRAASKERVDLMLRLAGEKGTKRLVENAKASGSDPTHVVALHGPKEVDAEVVGWMRRAYERAAKAAKAAKKG